MQYFKDEIDTLMTAMRDLMTRMATQDSDADDVAQGHGQRIKALENRQDLEGNWADDRQRIEKLEEYRAADRERIKELERDHTRLGAMELQMHSVMRTLEGLAVWKRCIERTVDPNGDIDLT